MKLSPLQKFIVATCLGNGRARHASQGEAGGGKVDRKIFHQFYGRQIKKTKEKYHESIITKSLERLIDREYMTGFGKRTPHKWFITHVLLTKNGVKLAEQILSERQEKLPLK